MPLVIADSGPLVAAFNALDADHNVCAGLLRRADLTFVIPALCVGETAQLLGARGRWDSESLFLRAVEVLDVQLPDSGDWVRIAEEVERYASFDIGAADASVIVLAERLGTSLVATLDHRHFRAIRPKHVEAFTLLPEL